MKLLKKEKKIPKGKYRIIKIGKDALFEFIHESLKDQEELFFDISDPKSIITYTELNLERGELIFMAKDEDGSLDFSDLDMQKIYALPDTTDSLYNGEARYIDLSKKELIK